MENKLFTLSSPVFNEGGIIPDKYTCKGTGISPPLSIENTPEEAASLAIIVHDPDAPGGDFLHWTIWNISATTTEIDEDLTPVNTTEGTSDFGKIGYGAPCPPSGSHRYVFDVYALSDLIDLHLGAKRQDLEQAIHALTIARASLTGIVIA
jgi:Raf kinase inhibitor-like YbhB/YbcL family protein